MSVSEAQRDQSPEIALVVPVRNGAQHVSGMLESLLAQQTRYPWELVVVDNGSTDETVEVVRALLSEDRPSTLLSASVVDYAMRLGYASPRNAGVHVTSAPRLGFCDSDDRVAHGWIDAMVTALDTSELVASAAHPIGKPRSPSDLPVMFGTPVAHAGGMGCSRALFDLLGGFDPYFDLGGEDVDFSIRARAKSGVEPILVEDAVYEYQLRETPIRNLRQGYRDGRSRVRLFRRHRDVLQLEPAKLRLLVARVTDHVRWIPRLFRKDDRCGYLRSCGLLVGCVVWSVRCRVRWF